jgi:hypothetical protein
MKGCEKRSIFGYARVFLLVLLMVCGCGTSVLAATYYTISGTVKAGDGTGVSSIHMTLSGPMNQMVSTDSHGNYNFTNIVAGSYTITPSGNGCTFSPLQTPVDLASGNSIGNDFSVTFGISGTVTLSGVGLSGATVTLSGTAGATTTTDPSGNYTFSGLSKGAYTVTPDKLAYKFSPSHKSVSIKTAGSIATNFGAKWVTYSVKGTASIGTPIANAQIDLVDSAGTVITATTSSKGSFSIHSTGITPPFMLSVPTSSGTLYSVSANWGASTIINLTPLTDIIIRSWYGAQGVDMATAFADPVTYPPPTPTEVLVLRTMVQNTVQPWLQAAGVKTASFNAISTPFAANGKTVDGVLNLINETLLGTGKIAVTINGNQKTQNPTIREMMLNPSVESPTIQNTTFDSDAGILTITTTVTVEGNQGSPTVTTSVVPTSLEQEDALEGINTTITNFVDTVNLKGASLQASDLIPYIDPDYFDNGMSGSDWAADVVSQTAGLKMSFSGLQINSLDTTNNVANVSFQVSSGNQTDIVTTNFKLVNDTWLVSGNGYVARIAVSTWAWDHPNEAIQFTNSTRFGAYDPQQNNVQSVTVSGPGITGSQDVPMICDSAQLNNLPLCGNAHGPDNTQRAFELDIQSFWPPVGSQYVFTLSTASGGPYSYTYTVGNEYGFDSTGNPVLADYPIVTLTSTPSLNQILNGVTVTGSVYVPIWSWTMGHFNFEGPGGTNNNVSNRDIYVQWIGTPVPGQYNKFTITIPKSTIHSSYPCQGGSGICYNITFQGQTGDIQGGWFGFDAMDPTVSYGGSTNNGVEIH